MDSVQVLKPIFRSIIDQMKRDGAMAFGKILEQMEAGFQKSGHRAIQPGRQRRRVLIIRLDEIGDNVLNSAFLKVDELFEWMYRVCSEMLWERHYDLCVLPRWDVDETLSAILSFACGARERVGFSENVSPLKSRMDHGFDRFLTQVVMTPPYLVQQALPAGRAIHLAGKTPLRESAALVALSELYLGGDTGLTHIAAAASRPIVEWNAHPRDVMTSTYSAYVSFYPWQADAVILRPEHAIGDCQVMTRGFGEIAGCQSKHEPHCIKTIDPHKIGRVALHMLQQIEKGKKQEHGRS